MIIIKDYFGGGENAHKLTQYVETVFRPEDSVLQEVREGIHQKKIPPIQVRKMDGLHLEVMTRMMNPCKIVEIGTLVGYSTICIARGMNPQGKLFTFELNPDYAEIARANLVKAGVSDRVEVIVGPALKKLESKAAGGPVDMVFVDADKENYPDYFKWAAENLRVGGLLIGDNTFGFGMVGDERLEFPKYEPMVNGVREFNRSAAQGGRFRATLLPTGEGMTVAVKIR